MPSPSVTCPRCGDVVQASATQGHCAACLLDLAIMGDPSLESSTERQPLGTIGDYELLEELARGGMGVVFKARQGRLDRTVAVKMMIDGHLATKETTARFLREASAAANLDHPHIVPIYEVGEEAGERFFAMKFVRGGTLASRLPDILELSPKDRVRLILKVVHALEYAHEHGVLHRDLKPSNILLDSGDEPLLTDFGLAKLMAETSDTTQLTLTTTVLGSPSYMAPEQAQGGIKDATTAADVYGVGAILYELLTGVVPFEGTTPMETLQNVIHKQPKPLGDFGNEIDPDLETLCLKCLEKEPHRRYTSMKELALELERFLAGKPIVARPVSKPEALWRWCRRNPALASVASLAMISTVAGAVGVLWQWQEAKSARRLAEAQRDSARWETYQAKMASASSAARFFEASALQQALATAPDEHRGWEWRYMQSLLAPAHYDLGPIRGDPSRIAIDETEQYLAQKFFLVDPAEGTNVATLWDLNTGSVHWAMPAESNLSPALSHVTSLNNGVLTVSNAATRETFLRHDYGITGKALGLGVTASPHHFLIVDDDFMDVWDARNRKSVRVNRREGDNSPRMVAVPQKGPMAFINDDTHVVYDQNSGKELARFPSLALQRFIAASPDNKTIAIGGLDPDNDIRLIDAHTSEELARFQGHSNDTLAIVFDATGTRLASGSVDRTVRVWDVATQRELAWMGGHLGDVNRVAFSPDGNSVASVSSDQTVRLWNSATGQPEGIWLGHEREPLWVHFSPFGRWLASSDGDVTKVWDMNKPGEWLHGHSSFVYDVAFSPDGSQVASVAWDQTMRIWDVDGRREIRRVDLDGIGLGVSYAPSGEYLAVATLDSLRWWHRSSGNVIEKSFDVGERALNHLTPAFSSDSGRIALGLLGEVIIWDSQTGVTLATLPHDSGIPVADSGFAKAGNYLYTVAGAVAHVWDLDRNEVVASMKADSRLLALTVSADGSLLATTSEADGVTLWDTKTFRPITKLPHSSRVFTAVFDTTTTRLFTGANDGIIRVWDLTHFQHVGSLHGHTRYVHSLALGPDDKTLASGSGDHSVKLWIAE